jgi:hypothetical protein
VKKELMIKEPEDEPLDYNKQYINNTDKKKHLPKASSSRKYNLVFIKTIGHHRIQNGNWDTDADSVSSRNQEPC